MTLRGCHFCGCEFVASPKALEINAEAFHPQPNLAFGQAQIARGTGHVAIAGLEFSHDHLVFQRGHGGIERAGGAFLGWILFLQRRRQMMRFNRLPRTQQNGALDAILQFAHVAGPMVADQQINRRGGYAPHVFTAVLAELVHEMIGQQQQV